MFLWVEDKDGEVQYSYYNMAKLNAEFDKVESKTSKYVEMDSSAVKSACYGSFRHSKSNKVMPNKSNQGVEFTDSNFICIIGGKEKDNPGISKLTGSQAECEGIQLKGDYIYFGIKKKPNRYVEQYIYRIPKSAF